MKIHVLQHSFINTLGTIEEYAKIKNHRLESTRFYETKNPSELDSFDLLIIMGEPIGVYDYKENPWLRTCLKIDPHSRKGLILASRLLIIRIIAA